MVSHTGQPLYKMLGNIIMKAMGSLESEHS